MRTKLIVGSLIVVMAISYLVYAGAKSGWVYYVDVDGFQTNTQYRTQRIRLCGRVDEAAAQRDPIALVTRFELVGTKARMPVEYHGVLPDMFKPGCDVVMEGKLDQAGVFQADVMLTKCASKYEAEDHAKRLGPKS